jgi:hypothetical protein
MEATPKCACGNQRPDARIHFTRIGCPHESAALDPWHYTGIRSVHGDLQSAEFITLCKEKLPQRELPFTIGITGYLDFESDMLSETSAWCLDKLGRVAILLNGNFMFQRYVNGDYMMKYKENYGFSELKSGDIVDFTALLA